MNPPPGYTFRPATREDLDAIVRVVDASDLATVGFTDPVRDELVFTWNTVGFELGRDTRVALDVAGRIVAYAEVVAHDPSVQIRSWIQIEPQHRGRGLGSALLRWVEELARAKLPRDPAQVPLRGGVPATDHAARELLAAHGFAQVRSFWHLEKSLDADEPVDPPPEGITYRPSSRGAEGDRALFLIDDESFREHFGYEPYSFDDWSTEWFGDPNYDPGLVFVAHESDEPVGLSMGLVLEGIGLIGVLAVRAPWRRRGIGRGLLRQTFAELSRRGIGQVRLGVDTQNATGAAELYRGVGMTVRREWAVYEKLLDAQEEPVGAD